MGVESLKTLNNSRKVNTHTFHGILVQIVQSDVVPEIVIVEKVHQHIFHGWTLVSWECVPECIFFSFCFLVSFFLSLPHTTHKCEVALEGRETKARGNFLGGFSFEWIEQTWPWVLSGEVEEKVVGSVVAQTLMCVSSECRHAFVSLR